MRVAIISRVFSKAGGGAESYSVAIAEQLCQHHDIHVFAQESNHPVEGVTYHRVWCLSKKPRWVNQLLFAVSTWRQTRQGFDVVHSHENTWHGQIQTVHVRPTRFNLFHGRHGLKLALRWLKVGFSLRLITYVFLEGARFKFKPGRQLVGTSQTLRDECEAAYPGSASMLSVITPGTSVPLLAVTREQAREHARARMGVKLHGVYLLFVANDYARKGLKALLEALALCPKQVTLWVVGNTQQAPRFRVLATQLNVQDRVEFLGSLEDMSSVYAAADCLVHPTLEDSFAMVVLEAMAHQIPVVVSGPEHCGISKQLQSGQQALLLDEPTNAKTLAALIVQVLESPVLRDHLIHNALAFAQQHTWARAAQSYEALYQQTLEHLAHDHAVH